jgi:hypothetical protein
MRKVEADGLRGHDEDGVAVRAEPVVEAADERACLVGANVKPRIGSSRSANITGPWEWDDRATRTGRHS